MNFSCAFKYEKLTNPRRNVITPLKKIPKLEYMVLEGNQIELKVTDFRAHILSEIPKLKYYNWTVLTKEVSYFVKPL